MLDLSADRVVEACVIVGIAWRDPALYFPALILVATWYVNITIFLAVGAALEGPSAKLIEYPPGILERTEAIIFFMVLGLLETTAITRPLGPILCYAMAALEIVTGAQRLLFGMRMLRSAMKKEAMPRTVARPAMAPRATVLSPPIAARKPHQVPSPNGSRKDDYYWLRDDTRKSKEVLAYLNAENTYTDSMLAAYAYCFRMSYTGNSSGASSRTTPPCLSCAADGGTTCAMRVGASIQSTRDAAAR